MLSPMQPIAQTADPLDLAGTLRETVTTVCRDFPRRHVWNPGQLDGCADWLIDRLAAMGYAARAHTFEAEFWTDAAGMPTRRRVRNLLVTQPGRDPLLPALVIGAHYDSRHAMPTRHAREPSFERVSGASASRDATTPAPPWHGHPARDAWAGRPCHTRSGSVYADTPGANDNASGIAALLAILAALRGSRPERTLEAAFWVNEEYPFFRAYWSRGRRRKGVMWRAYGMGSRVHAQRLRETGRPVLGAIALDTLGCYDENHGYAAREAPHVKRWLLNRLFPRQHDYATFLTDARYLAFARRAAAAFRETPDTPRLVVRGFPLVAALNQGWSDDWAFWKAGIPAFCVTDGAYIRSAHYHRITDTPETLNYPVFAATVEGLTAAVRKLAAAQ